MTQSSSSSQIPYQLKIKIVGVGGGGINALNRMIEMGVSSDLVIAIDTDSQCLHTSKAKSMVWIGENITRGLGAGGDIAIGIQSAKDSADEILESLKGTDLVLLTSCFGGGTGTGATPIIASIIQELGSVCLCLATTPFLFEGTRRLAVAKAGIEILQVIPDTLIVVPNDKLLQVAAPHIPFTQALQVIDDYLSEGAKSVVEIFSSNNDIPLDTKFAFSILRTGGGGIISHGQAAGGDRASNAVNKALSVNLIDVSLYGAKGLILNILAGDQLDAQEVSTISQVVKETAQLDASIIYSAGIDPSLGNDLKVNVIANGFPSRTKIVPRERLPFSLGRPREGIPVESTRAQEMNKSESSLEVPAFLRRRRSTDDAEDERPVVTAPEAWGPGDSPDLRIPEEELSRAGHLLRRIEMESDHRRIAPMSQGNFDPGDMTRAEGSRWTQRRAEYTRPGRGKKFLPYELSLAFPKLLSKRFESTFLIHIYLPEVHKAVETAIKDEFSKTPTSEKTALTPLHEGQTITIKLYSPVMEFKEPITKKLESFSNKFLFTGKPLDSAEPGQHVVNLSVLDEDGKLELFSLNANILVRDFAFDHVSRPLVLNLSSFALGLGSFAMFLLSLLSQIDTTLGISAGATAAVLASMLQATRIMQFQKLNTQKSEIIK